MSATFPRPPYIFRTWVRDPNSIGANSQHYTLSSFPPNIPEPPAPPGPPTCQDWPNPRGTFNRVYWSPTASRNLINETVQARGTHIAQRVPIDAFKGQTQPLGIPETLQTPAPPPVTLPYNEYDWPNPSLRIVQRSDWEDWFKLSLQQVIQQNQYDWPNPTLRVVQRPDWADSFKLSLQQTIQPNQYNWPNPILRVVQRQDYQQGLTVTALAAPAPFAQTDWPDPVRSTVRRPDWQGWFDLPL